MGQIVAGLCEDLESACLLIGSLHDREQFLARAKLESSST